MKTTHGSIKNKYKLRAAVILLCMIMAAPVFMVFSAYAAEPGTLGDPIALKSYVDSQLESLEVKLVNMFGGGGANAGTAGGGAAGTGAAGTSASGDTASLSARIIKLEETVEWLIEANTALRRDFRQSGAAAGGGAPESFIPIEVSAGQRIISGAGTEIVLRTGKANAIRGELGALVDLISGKDLDAGEDVPVNHLILSPRDDNRGMRIAEDAWVLIRGPYEIR